jgi:hypothetical protein
MKERRMRRRIEAQPYIIVGDDFAVSPNLISHDSVSLTGQHQHSGRLTTRKNEQ